MQDKFKNPVSTLIHTKHPNAKMEGSILFDGAKGTDTGLLKLSIPVAGKSRRVFSVIAADNSGSMSGRPWQQVR